MMPARTWCTNPGYMSPGAPGSRGGLAEAVSDIVSDMAMPTIRFDLRLPDFATTTRDAQYAAALEQAVWAEEHGFATAVLSEHHGTDDGYIPSPLVMAAAMAARTSRITITIGAL